MEGKSEEGSVVETIQEKIEERWENDPRRWKMILRVGEKAYEELRGHTIWNSKWSEQYFMGIRVVEDPLLDSYHFVLEREGEG